MTRSVAFVGDIHGNLAALRGLLAVLNVQEPDHLVFLGDYINRGPDSRGVMDLLHATSQSRPTSLLRGNHEETLLNALDGDDLAPFLKIGGASTIRSYAGDRVGPDVMQVFRESLSDEHVALLRSMSEDFVTSEVFASHRPLKRQDARFRISAHIPVGQLPAVRRNSASIDTGCGIEGGRLTALLWPSLNYVQVDAAGSRICAG